MLIREAHPIKHIIVYQYCMYISHNHLRPNIWEVPAVSPWSETSYAPLLLPGLLGDGGVNVGLRLLHVRRCQPIIIPVTYSVHVSSVQGRSGRPCLSHITTGAVFAYQLRYIVGFGLVEMAISTNLEPTVYHNL